MIHGEIAAKKTKDAIITPPSEGNPRRYRCRQIHNPQKGRNASMVGFAKAPIPYNAPNRAQPCQAGHPCNSSASRKMHASKKGVTVVSQIQWIDQYQTYGHNPHARADQYATRSPNVLWAIR